MGTVVYLSSRTYSNRAGDVEETQSGELSDLVQKCSLLIGAAISGRIHELGGTDHDVDQLARSAAYAVFLSSATDAFGV